MDIKKIKDFIQKHKSMLIKVGIAVLILLFILHIRGCIVARKKAVIPPRPVHIGMSETKDVPVYLLSFGTLTTLFNVDIKSQITGKILEVHFKEGDELAEGDLLFTIDPSEYRAELDKAEAALAEDEVEFKMKNDTLERNRQVFDKKLISQQDFEKCQTDASASAAQVELDQANVELAGINLQYCSIRSPINGRAGKRQVDPGNIVIANNGPTLVNVKTMDPLYIDFTMPEKELPEIRKAMDQDTLKIEITVEGDEKVYSGDLKFIDNTVDDSTGTIFLRAIINNEKRELWPGQFVKIKLILRIEKDVVLVPYQAVQLGQKGSFVFVVSDKNMAILKEVTKGQRQGDDIVVKEGVKSGETVVTVGQMGLSDKVPVVVIPDPDKEAKGKEVRSKR